MLLGVNMFLAALRTHKMSLSRAKNIYTPANINSIVVLLSLIVTMSDFVRNIHSSQLALLKGQPSSLSFLKL